MDRHRGRPRSSVWTAVAVAADGVVRPRGRPGSSHRRDVSLRPRASLLRPRASLLRPRAPLLRPRAPLLRPRARLLRRRTQPRRSNQAGSLRRARIVLGRANLMSQNAASRTPEGSPPPRGCGSRRARGPGRGAPSDPTRHANEKETTHHESNPSQQCTRPPRRGEGPRRSPLRDRRRSRSPSGARPGRPPDCEPRHPLDARGGPPGAPVAARRRGPASPEEWSS